MKRTAIESLLPGIIRRTLVPGNPASGFLDVMEQLHAPSEAVLDSLATSFDPRRTRAEFVPLLARWVNLDRILDDGSRRSAIRIEPGRIRELTAIAARLSRWRGTCRGLLLFLETATGTRGFAIDEQVPARNGAIRPFHIRV